MLPTDLRTYAGKRVMLQCWWSSALRGFFDVFWIHPSPDKAVCNGPPRWDAYILFVRFGKSPRMTYVDSLFLPCFHKRYIASSAKTLANNCNHKQSNPRFVGTHTRCYPLFTLIRKRSPTVGFSIHFRWTVKARCRPYRSGTRCRHRSWIKRGCKEKSTTSVSIPDLLWVTKNDV